MLEKVAWWLILIGALNWLLVGLFQFDAFAALGGSVEWISRVIDILVGVAGVYLLPQAFGVKMITKKE